MTKALLLATMLFVSSITAACSVLVPAGLTAGGAALGAVVGGPLGAAAGGTAGYLAAETLEGNVLQAEVNEAALSPQRYVQRSFLETIWANVKPFIWMALILLWFVPDPRALIQKVRAKISR